MGNKEQVLKNKVYLVANSRIYPIVKDISKIGRKLDNDIVIQDSMISRYHAEIRNEDEKYVLYDINSTGGTYLNNERIENARIKSGDTIILAETPLLFMIEINKMQVKSNLQTETLNSVKSLDASKAEEKTKPFNK